MKTIFLILLCLPLFSTAQKVALFDMNLSKPIIYTDSVTVQQATNLFPVAVNDFDTLYANLDYISSMLKVRQRSKMKSFELHSGSTILEVKRVPFAYGDRYLITAKTKIGEIQSNFNMAPIDKSNAKNSVMMERIMEYIKVNKDTFRPPTEIHPKFYNVIVITE